MRKIALSMIRGSIFLAAVLMLPTPSIRADSQARTKYEPSWESLDARPTPQWFRDAKFGVFICWGLYSVPAWSPKGTYAEWYQYFLQERSQNGQVYDYHVKTYGKNFRYEDFAPLFKAELWNPEEWADLLQNSGAKYIVFTTKHHAGDCLWPNREASRAYGRPWNTMEMGPKRDLVGDLAAAVRSKGIRLGLYYSLYEWYHPLWKSDKKRFVNEHLFPQFKDLITRYRPDIVWSDGEWDMTSEEWRSPELLAWLFNTAPNEPDLVINDRWGKDARHKHGGFYTTEYGSGLDDDRHPWEESRGMGSSYGYNRKEDIADYRSARELILMLVDVVSRGGNLCLDIGPRADGKIPVIMQERLLQIGGWLKANGEAIFGTHMWRTPCQWSEGLRPETKRGEFMTGFNILKETLQPETGRAIKEIFFTTKDGDLYAIPPRWPGEHLVIKNVKADRKTRVTWLATGQELTWKNQKDNLVIRLPAFDPEALSPELLYAHAFRISDIAK